MIGHGGSCGLSLGSHRRQLMEVHDNSRAQSLFWRSPVAATTTSSAESPAWHSASRAGYSSPAMTTSIAMSGTHWGPSVQVLFADMYLGQYSCFLVISEKTWRTNDALRVWGQELVAHSEGYVHTFFSKHTKCGDTFWNWVPRPLQSPLILICFKDFFVEKITLWHISTKWRPPSVIYCWNSNC